MIDIDKFNEVELLDLNRRVVARLNFLQHMRAHSKMLNFSVGERVSFHPQGYPPLSGVITKYNRKTVSVLTEQGQIWNVAPALLTKVITQQALTRGNAPGGAPFSAR